EKIGFIGPNGAGKSTLLHILAGLLEADDGNISKNNNLRISMLEQTPVIPEGITVKNFLYKGESPVIKLLAEYHECLENPVGAIGRLPLRDNHLPLLEELTEKMDKENGWEIENNYLSFLSELKLDNPDEIMDNLSGGMKKKAALARALASKPNLLILDEPTNHLDIEIIEWLEKYLGQANFSFIMVTHDRYFLDSVCMSIMELDKSRIYKYTGNYSTFLENREIRLSTEQNEQAKIKSILRRELEWLSRGPKARASKDKKRKMRIEELMDKRVQKEQENSEFSSSNRRLGKKILELHNIEKLYNNKTVISPFSYKFKKGERIGIIGPNGSGKSTFLNIISGEIVPDSGTIEKGINTEFGYYDQLSDHLTKAASENLTVLEYIKETAEQISLEEGKIASAAKFLEMFNFPSGTHRTLLTKLSGGEKRRLYLIKTLINNPNFLILDEPTNDLDLDTMRRLEDYVLSFSGTIIVVSHDRAFLDRTTDFLFLFDGLGGIKGFTGNYSEYREFTQIRKDLACKVSATGEKGKNDIARRDAMPGRQQVGCSAMHPSNRVSTGNTKRKLTYKENQEFNNLEEEIDILEAKKIELEALFSKPGINPVEIEKNNRKYKIVTENIEIKLNRWVELAEIIG
ncbi:MAG: ABC-F family ATP-binding cassette domain-containing protein, partial [Spirochaetota bacterium]|nr:ABC-F family ATP-binding cassette domain-containing protein [Spirochaetota bacterium]